MVKIYLPLTPVLPLLSVHPTSYIHQKTRTIKFIGVSLGGTLTETAHSGQAR